MMGGLSKKQIDSIANAVLDSLGKYAAIGKKLETELGWKIILEPPKNNFSNPLTIHFEHELSVSLGEHHWHLCTVIGEYESDDLVKLQQLLEQILTEKLIIVSKFQGDKFKLSYSCFNDKIINDKTEKPNFISKLIGYRPDKIKIRSWNGKYDREFKI